jgi:DNA polymerase-1
MGMTYAQYVTHAHANQPTEWDNSMEATWLVIDCPYLCRRAQYSMGAMQHRGRPVGVIFGFIAEVLRCCEYFGTRYVVHCWDQGPSKRAKLYPPYKANRKPAPPTSATGQRLARQAEHEYRAQVATLISDVLPLLGCEAVLRVPGYEADDLIARICLDIPAAWPTDTMIIISADHDLYQCLAPQVSIWAPNTRKLLTYQWFIETHGIQPHKWADVKALAGCSGDNVAGIAGIGEKTAVKYLRGYGIPANTRTRIEKNAATWLRNLSLVSLPLSGTPDCHLQRAPWPAVVGLQCDEADRRWGIGELLSGNDRRQTRRR